MSLVVTDLYLPISDPEEQSGLQASVIITEEVLVRREEHDDGNYDDEASVIITEEVLVRREEHPQRAIITISS